MLFSAATFVHLLLYGAVLLPFTLQFSPVQHYDVLFPDLLLYQLLVYRFVSLSFRCLRLANSCCFSFCFLQLHVSLFSSASFFCLFFSFTFCFFLQLRCALLCLRWAFFLRLRDAPFSSASRWACSSLALFNGVTVHKCVFLRTSMATDLLLPPVPGTLNVLRTFCNVNFLVGWLIRLYHGSTKPVRFLSLWETESETVFLIPASAGCCTKRSTGVWISSASDFTVSSVILFLPAQLYASFPNQQILRAAIMSSPALTI